MNQTTLGAADLRQEVRLTWPAMAVDTYAAFERATGVKVEKIGRVWWRRVRPFLYRPLVPFKPLGVAEATLGVDRIGAFQHAVEAGPHANSFLNPIVFDDLRGYDIRKLRKGVRNQIKKAVNSGVTVRRILDEAEFVDSAHRVYLSFYDRTRYSFKRSRRSRAGFSQWARAVYRFDEAVVLGSFLGSELLSFEISCLVEGAVILKTIVNSEKALTLAAPDLCLHYTRMNAREQPEIDTIYDSMLTHGPGINEFKILRGARVLALPAVLHMNPALRWLIRQSSSRVSRQLLGLGDADLLTSGLAESLTRSHAVPEPVAR